MNTLHRNVTGLSFEEMSAVIGGDDERRTLDRSAVPEQPTAVMSPNDPTKPVVDYVVQSLTLSSIFGPR